ncbi:MAG: hypothetical protein GX221_04370 [Candidatus Riflebacteria bacterium]|nr:hypothetical protein [Candidatus Riflebacteria bacterium]
MEKTEHNFSEHLKAVFVIGTFSLILGSFVNCLFLWLAYGRAYDMAGIIFSLLLALGVYFSAFSVFFKISEQKRLILVAVFLGVWLIALGPLLRAFGLP